MQVAQIDIATISEQQTVRNETGSGKNVCALAVSGVKTTTVGASHRKSMVVWSSTAAGLTVLAPGNTSRKASWSKRTAILNENVAKFCKSASFGESKDFESHVAKQARGHSAHERSKMALGHLVIERFVGQCGVKQRIEAPVEIRQGFDAMARTDRRQCEAQAKRRNGPLAPTKLRVFAAGVTQRWKTPIGTYQRPC